MAKVKIKTILAIAGSVIGLVAIAVVGLMLGYSVGENALEGVSPTPGDPEIRPDAEDGQPESSVPALDRDTLLVANLVKTLNPTPPPRIVEQPIPRRPSEVVQQPYRRTLSSPVQDFPVLERRFDPPSPNEPIQTAVDGNDRVVERSTPTEVLPTLPPVSFSTPPVVASEPPPPPPPPPPTPPPTTRQGTVAMRVTSASLQGANVVLNVSLQNNTGRVVRFLYGLMSVTDDNGQSLSASTNGLPGELPPNGEVYRGTVSIPASLARDSSSVSLYLADYPSRQLQLNVANVPLP